MATIEEPGGLSDVPKHFLEDVLVHVDGNGAPQFGEKGLVRVLIPSGGQEEVRFVSEGNGHV